MRKLILISVIMLSFGVLPSYVFAQESDSEMEEMTMLTNPQYFLVKAREFYVLGQSQYNEGEYDLSADSALKAQQYADKYRKAVQLLAYYKKALAKIKEAEALIAEARTLNATEDDLGPSMEKLNEATQFLTDKNYELSANAADESCNLSRDLINKLKKKETVVAGNENQYWKTYKVRLIPEKRDCLWRIAQYDFIYKNPWKWPLIWKANKDQIVDPDLIYPGQVFNIPKLDEETPK